MGRPYSLDLRERVVTAYDEGGKPTELAKRYRISLRSVHRLLERRRETGSIEPLHGKPGPKPVLAEHLEKLQAVVSKKPDATLEELRAELGIQVGISTLWRGLRDLGMTFKKSHPRRGAATT